jgi:hypothetical protein
MAQFSVAMLFLFYSACCIFLAWLMFRPRKVKVSMKVDTEVAEKARTEIGRLRSLITEMGADRRKGLDRIADNFHRYAMLARWIQDDRDAAEAEVERLKKDNKLLRKVWSETGAVAQHRAAQVVKLKLEHEQLQVQLAACLTAAEGVTNPEHVAKGGSYGWSLAYQKVLDLRRKYDLFRGRITYIDNL